MELIGLDLLWTVSLIIFFLLLCVCGHRAIEKANHNLLLSDDSHLAATNCW